MIKYEFILLLNLFITLIISLLVFKLPKNPDHKDNLLVYVLFMIFIIIIHLGYYFLIEVPFPLGLGDKL